MYSHTKRSDPIEEDTDDDNVSTSSPPPQMNKNKKRRVSMPIDTLTDDDEEEEEQSDDENQETEEAEPATNKDCFRRQGNQVPPNWACQTLDQQEIRARSPNPPNQTDTTTLLREELRRLQEENNKIKSQLVSTTRQEAAQTAWVTPAKNHNHGGQCVAALQRTADTLLVAVRNFATTFVFPKAKFLQTELTARQYCMLAVAKNDIVLPAPATVEQFAAMYHNTLDKRVRQIRLNSNTGARVKFIADLKQGKVPDGFSYNALRKGYRDYIIDDDDSEEKRERKKAGLVAFHYFVD
eukprot:scaffold4672_cov58-Cylindrotheca_fusiformis.AAC.2